MSTNRFKTFTISATYLPQHADNKIHTDAGAQAAGFPRALVAGTTTYAYLTHPVATAWGLDWVGAGGGEIWFRSPVFSRERVDCVPVEDPDGSVVVEARVGSDERPRATFRAVRASGACQPMRDGEALEPLTVRLDGHLGSDYGARAGDSLGLYARHNVVHPAVWPWLASLVCHSQVARGPWIHVRSIVRHHALVSSGATATVRGVVVERFERRGERAIMDLVIDVEGRTIASLQHEAIVGLRDDRAGAGC